MAAMHAKSYQTSHQVPTVHLLHVTFFFFFYLCLFLLPARNEQFSHIILPSPGTLLPSALMSFVFQPPDTCHPISSQSAVVSPPQVDWLTGHW